MGADPLSLALQLGGGILGGLFGRPSRSGYQKTAYNDIGGANQLAFGTLQDLLPYAMAMLQYGSEVTEPAATYWRKILSGDRGMMTEALAPEIGRIAAGYEQAKNNIGQFAPMGGGRSTLLAELPFSRSRDISTLFSTLRPQAATVLPQIGSTLQGIGLGGLGAASGLLGGVRSGAGTVLNSELGFMPYQGGATAGAAYGGAQLGKTLYDLIKSGGKKP